MYNIGDIVSVQIASIENEIPYGRNSIGGLFPINRRYYEIISDVGNGIYVIGIGNIAIAAVSCNVLHLEPVSRAYEPVEIDGVVSVREGARNYMGYPLPSYVYRRKYTVIHVVCDRVLIGDGTQILAVKGEDLI